MPKSDYLQSVENMRAEVALTVLLTNSVYNKLCTAQKAYEVDKRTLVNTALDAMLEKLILYKQRGGAE